MDLINFMIWLLICGVCVSLFSYALSLFKVGQPMANILILVFTLALLLGMVHGDFPHLFVR